MNSGGTSNGAKGLKPPSPDFCVKCYAFGNSTNGGPKLAQCYGLAQ